MCNELYDGLTKEVSELECVALVQIKALASSLPPVGKLSQLPDGWTLWKKSDVGVLGTCMEKFSSNQPVQNLTNDFPSYW